MHASNNRISFSYSNPEFGAWLDKHRTHALKPATLLYVYWIQDLCADAFNVSLADIQSRKRTGPVALARHVAMSLCCSILHLSHRAVGNLFDRDRSDVITSCNGIAADISHDTNIARTVTDLEQHIISQLPRETPVTFYVVITPTTTPRISISSTGVPPVSTAGILPALQTT